jgi:homospermidine synthase
MFEEPSRGLCVPDDLPHERILERALPYLGTMFSGAIDWDPLMTRRDIFDQWSNAADGLDRSDPWQFCNFLVS